MEQEIAFRTVCCFDLLPREPARSEPAALKFRICEACGMLECMYEVCVMCLIGALTIRTALPRALYKVMSENAAFKGISDMYDP